MEKDLFKLPKFEFDVEKQTTDTNRSIEAESVSVDELFARGLIKTEPDEVVKVVEENQSLKTNLARLKRKFNKYFAEEKIKKVRLQEKFEELKNENKRLSLLMHDKDQDLFSLRKNNEFWQKQSRELELQLKNKSDELTVWRKDLSNLEQTVHSLGEKKAAIDQTIKNQKNHFDQITAKIKNAFQKNQILKSVIKKLKADRTNLIHELEQARVSIALQKKYLQDIHDRLVNSKKYR